MFFHLLTFLKSREIKETQNKWTLLYNDYINTPKSKQISYQQTVCLYFNLIEEIVHIDPSLGTA